LRDLQTVTWISRAAGLGTSWTALTQAGLISHAEACQIAGHNRLLQTLRIRLHYLASGAKTGCCSISDPARRTNEYQRVSQPARPANI